MVEWLQYRSRSAFSTHKMATDEVQAASGMETAVSNRLVTLQFKLQ